MAVLAAAAFMLAGVGSAAAEPAILAKVDSVRVHPMEVSGSDQCGRPISARAGNWYCPVPGTAATLRSLTSAAAPGFCNSSGCYQRYDDYRADFKSARGAWGFGTQLLGYEDHEVVWQLTGARMTAKPVYFRNSAYTTEVLFSGDLLNAAPGRLGDRVDGAYSLYNAGSVPAGTLRAWRPNGYTARDQDNFDHVQVIQFSWKHPEYPGYWYVYVKSLNATAADKADYRFRNVDQLPADPFGGGYRP